MIFCLSGPLPVERIPSLLCQIRDRHPLLSIKLLDEGKKNLYLTDQDVPALPCRIIPNCSETSWVEVVQEELRHPFSYMDGPLARLVLLQCPDSWDLVLVCDHGISDGFSAVFLARDLLTLLYETVPDLAPILLPPDIWSLVPASFENNPSVRMKLFAFRWFFQRYLRSRSSMNGGSILTPQSEADQAKPLQGLPEKHCYGIVHRTLTPLQTSGLVERCQSEVTTVQGALCTAWGQALNLLDTGRKSNHRKVSVPVSLRSRLPHAFQLTTGLYISTVNIPIVCSPNQEFWTNARQVKEKLSRAATVEILQKAVNHSGSS